MASSGCSDRETEAITIDDHVFEVPRQYLIEERIFWLPQSEKKGLLFITNPEAPIRERRSVLILSTSSTCSNKTPTVYGQLASVCEAAERQADDILQTQSSPLEKELWNGDPTQWVYRLTDKRGKGRGDIVVACSGNGLCFSLSNYADLVYNASLRDSEIERLPAIRKRIHELLSSWEKPTP